MCQLSPRNKTDSYDNNNNCHNREVEKRINALGEETSPGGLF